MTVTVPVTPEVLALARGDTANISLQFFNESSRAWNRVPCAGAAGGLACQIPHLSIWALVVETLEAVPQPVAQTPARPDIGFSPASSSAPHPLLQLTLAVIGLGFFGGLAARALRPRRATHAR